MSFVFDAPDVTAAGSYHFQFVAPDGLTVADGCLVAATGPDGNDVVPFGHATTRTSVLGLNARANEVPDSDTYAAVVHVQPSPDGLMQASAVSATLTTLLLLLATLVAHRLDANRIDSSTTLLLVLPGVVSTFLARPGEHSMVSRVLRGVRTLTASSAIIVYPAAALPALGLSKEVLRGSWLALALLSAVPSLALIVAVRRCRALAWT